jgi:hypothetical protein
MFPTEQKANLLTLAKTSIVAKWLPLVKSLSSAQSLLYIHHQYLAGVIASHAGVVNLTSLCHH